jgi:hypothetical protein
MERFAGCEARGRSVGQGNSTILCNPQVHFLVHKMSAMDLILNQLGPLHNFKSYLAKTHPINLCFYLRLRERSFTPKQMAGEITVLCFNLFTFRYQTGGQRSLNTMIDFPRLEAALDLFVTVIFISYCRPPPPMGTRPCFCWGRL